MIIAIDGPAGTGKSTIASIIADKLKVTFSLAPSRVMDRGVFHSVFRTRPACC